MNNGIMFMNIENKLMNTENSFINAKKKALDIKLHQQFMFIPPSVF